MTIREHFQRILDRAKYTTTGVVVPLVLIVLWRYPNLTKPQVLGGSALLGIVLAGVLVLVFRRRFLCPRCGTDLSKLHAKKVGRRGLFRKALTGDQRQFWQAWNACPNCGVSFDEEWGPIS